MSNADAPRRGWREKVETGIYRAHRLACPRSADRREGRGRCGCPYQVAVPDHRPGRTRLVTVEGTVTDARSERRRLMAAGRPAPPPTEAPDAPVFLHDLARSWFRTRSAILAPNTIAEADVDYRRRIKPALGAAPIAAVTRQRVEEFMAALVTDGASRRMVVGTIGTLRRILAAGVEWGHLPSNPASGLRLPAPDSNKPQTAERVLDREALRRLIDACGTTRIETMVRVMAEAGLRRGEIIALRWTDLRLADRRIDVRRTAYQVVRRNGDPAVKGERTTKGRRARKVAISQDLAARLAAWFDESVVTGGADATGFVWPGRRGRMMDAHTPNQALARTLTRAGLVDHDGRPLATPHRLRHGTASLALSAGVALMSVSRTLGHAHPNITARVYAHLLDDRELDAVADVFAPPHATDTLRETLREDEEAPKTLPEQAETVGDHHD